jgi:hypothetical protein
MLLLLLMSQARFVDPYGVDRHQCCCAMLSCNVVVIVTLKNCAAQHFHRYLGAYYIDFSLYVNNHFVRRKKAISVTIPLKESGAQTYKRIKDETI